MRRSNRLRGTLPARPVSVKKPASADGEGERPATRNEIRLAGVTSDVIAMQQALEAAYGAIVEHEPGRLLGPAGSRDRLVEQLERGLLAGIRAQSRAMYATIEAGRRAGEASRRG